MNMLLLILMSCFNGASAQNLDVLSGASGFADGFARGYQGAQNRRMQQLQIEQMQRENEQRELENQKYQEMMEAAERDRDKAMELEKAKLKLEALKRGYEFDEDGNLKKIEKSQGKKKNVSE